MNENATTCVYTESCRVKTGRTNTTNLVFNTYYLISSTGVIEKISRPAAITWDTAIAI